jgi:hypothetical protein
MGLDWCLQAKPRDNDNDKEEFYRLKYKLKLHRDVLYGENDVIDIIDIIDKNDDVNDAVNDDENNVNDGLTEDQNSKLEKKIADLEELFNNISVSPHDSVSNLSDNDMINLHNFTFGGSFISHNYDFRGKVIGQSDILNEKLKNEAFEHHSAEQSIEYAIKLQIFLESLNKETLNKDEQKDYNFIEKAIKWLKFWGTKGHGYYACY